MWTMKMPTDGFPRLVLLIDCLYGCHISFSSTVAMPAHFPLKHLKQWVLSFTDKITKGRSSFLAYSYRLC